MVNKRQDRTPRTKQKWQLVEDSPHAKELCPCVLVRKDVVPEGAVC